MYARKQLLIWTAVIFVLNLVLLTKLRDDAATARTQLEELTPTELTQIDITNLLESNTVTYSEQETEAISYESQFSEAKTEGSSEPYNSPCLLRVPPRVQWRSTMCTRGIPSGKFQEDTILICVLC